MLGPAGLEPPQGLELEKKTKNQNKEEHLCCKSTHLQINIKFAHAKKYY